MPEFTIQYAAIALDDIRQMRKFHQQRLINAIVLHLKHEPTKISRSRIKLLTQPFWSQFRLRVDEFRVYYDVDMQLLKVNILRVLEKGNQQTPEASP